MAAQDQIASEFCATFELAKTARLNSLYLPIQEGKLYQFWKIESGFPDPSEVFNQKDVYIDEKLLAGQKSVRFLRLPKLLLPSKLYTELFIYICNHTA